MKPSYSRFCWPWLAALTLCLSGIVAPAQAGDHGGGTAGAEPIKLTLNLGNPGTNGRFLVCEIALEASPEVTQAVIHHRPKVIHNLILLFSDETAERLLTLQGKHDLADKIIGEVNKAINEKAETGVHEALFTQFIIQ